MSWLDIFRSKPRLPIEKRHKYCSSCGKGMVWRPKWGDYNTQTGVRHVWEAWECINADNGGLHDFDIWDRDEYRRNVHDGT